MFDKIIYISDHFAKVKLAEGTNSTINLMNLHIIFKDDYKTILGEVDDLDGDTAKVRFLGEISNGKLLAGIIRKPALDAEIRVISEEEIPLIVGKDEQGYMELGVSPFYNDYPVYLDVNSFFSNHFAVFGNSGSGKSCGVTRLFQNMFHDERLFPYKANILLFDSSGEYFNAFSNLNSINSNYHYRFYSTNESNSSYEKLRLPIFLLNTTDLALLLQVTNHSQLPIIERMLKLALIFSQNDMNANAYKNHLIAKAIMNILYTNETSPNKRNEVFSILESCSTPEFNLEAIVQGTGYTRKFRDCFLIDNQGQFSESVLLTEYVSSFINNEYDDYEPSTGVYYTLNTLEKALNFTLISEGWLRNKNTYGDAITLKVRLHSLVVGENAKYFEYNDYVSLETYLSSMLISDGNKYQIVNINLDDVDDDFAKVITKIYSRLIFQFTKELKDRASIPFHIVVDEAHRYIQNDTDRFLFGYNIFERIAKEGRKYGVILGIISQRPVELSDTVISQCSSFMIFKINHPADVDYIQKMIPNISEQIVEKQKSLQSGTCLGFGKAFRIPLIIKMQMPDPVPLSGDVDVVTIWNGNTESKPIEIKSNVSHNLVRENHKPELPSFINKESEDIPIPVEPTGTVVEIPRIPHEVQQGKKYDAISGDSSMINNDVSSTFMPVNRPNSLVSQAPNVGGFTSISSGMDLSDNWMSNMIGNNHLNNMNEPSVNNMSMQSAIPDFSMTSAQERELSIPTNAVSIPTSLAMAANKSVVTPTVEMENNDDYGTVKIVPPTPVVGLPANDIDTSSFSFGKNGVVNNSSSNGMPVTDSGKPLVNLVG